MKLLNCLECHDIVSLAMQGTESRLCRCEKSYGRYIDEYVVEYSGPCRIIGLINSEYVTSLKAKVIPYITRYDWFPIPEGNNIKRIAE